MTMEGQHISSQLQLAQQSHEVALQQEIQARDAESQLALRCQQLEKHCNAALQPQALCQHRPE